MRKRHRHIHLIAMIGLIAVIGSTARATEDAMQAEKADAPETQAAETPQQLYQTQGRNMHVPATDLPDHIGPDNLLWHVQLQNGPFFNVIQIEGDRVYCGVAAKNLPEKKNGGKALLCLNLRTGAVLWESILTDRGGAYGLSAVPLIEDDAIYMFTGGDMERLDKAGKEIWRTPTTGDYFGQMHGAHSTGVIVGNYWYQPTGFATGSDCQNWVSNSNEWPWHPNIVVVDKRTGEKVAQDDIVLGPHQHGAWGSMSAGKVNGKDLVFWGSPYGYVHAFEAPDSFEAGTISTLKEVWRCDANPADYRVTEEGMHLPYAAWMGNFGPKAIGWGEIVGAPVFHEGKVYVSITRDKAYSNNKKGRRIGNGAITCIDPKGTGDITKTNKVWINRNINRTFCPVSIVDDKLMIATHAGYVRCLKLDSGEELWQADIQKCIWNYFQNVGDGKVYVMNEKKDFFIFDANTGNELFHLEVDASNNPTVGMTHGMLIVGTQRSIAAYGGPELMKSHKPAPMPEKPQFEEGPDEEGGH